MSEPAPIILNLRVLAICLAGLWPGLSSPIFWIIAVDYVAWLLSYPERGVDKDVFRKADYPGQLYEFIPSHRFSFYFGRRRLMKRFRLARAVINADGFRGPEISPEEGRKDFRIMVLGDSFTFGAGVDDGEEFIRLIERRWNREQIFPRRIEIVNTAVGGYNTIQEIVSLKRYQPLYKPDMVWMFISLEDTFQWGKIVVKEDGTLFRPGAPLRSRLHKRATELSGMFWWYDYAHRWRHAEGYIPPLFDSDFTGYQAWKKAIRQYADLIGEPSRSVVFIAPGCWSLDDYPWKSVHHKIRLEVEARGLACVDLLPAIEGKEAAALWCHPLDQHPNAEGHRLFAQYVSDNREVMKMVRRRMNEVARVSTEA